MVIFSRINNNLYEVKYNNNTVGCITKVESNYIYKAINSHTISFDSLDAAKIYIEGLFNYTRN